LGFDDSNQLTVTTPISFGSDKRNKHITTYFRHSFQVASGLNQDLILNLRRDDGAVVYLNGQEIVRDNMPDGPVPNSQQAIRSVNDANETEFFYFEVSPAIEGRNQRSGG
jgi:hypothetical protein